MRCERWVRWKQMWVWQQYSGERTGQFSLGLETRTFTHRETRRRCTLLACFWSYNTRVLPPTPLCVECTSHHLPPCGASLADFSCLQSHLPARLLNCWNEVTHRWDVTGGMHQVSAQGEMILHPSKALGLLRSQWWLSNRSPWPTKNIFALWLSL